MSLCDVGVGTDPSCSIRTDLPRLFPVDGLFVPSSDCSCLLVLFCFVCAFETGFFGLGFCLVCSDRVLVSVFVESGALKRRTRKLCGSVPVG